MKILAGYSCCLSLFIAANAFAIPSKYEAFEAKVPMLANPIIETASDSGIKNENNIQGSFFNLEERVNAHNVPLNDAKTSWSDTAWRGERISAQSVIWTTADVSQVELSLSSFSGSNGSFPADCGKISFVRFTGAHDDYVNQDWVEDKGSTFIADIIDPVKKLDMPKNSFRPLWLSVDVPRNVMPGIYHAKITVTAVGSNPMVFDLTVEVLEATLPKPKDWSFYLDLWQHPWAVSRYHRVQDWSEEHFSLMRPLYEELANAGQKVITTTITKSAWNHQTYDDYDTMVQHTKMPDGTWRHDYTLFDRYVEFVMSCGITEAIACYTIVPWGNYIYYIDGDTGKEVKIQAKPGTKEFEDFWGPALKDLVSHLRGKGWLEIAYISMDERAPGDMRHATALLKQYVPELKIATAANFAPNQLDGVTLHYFVTEITHINDSFLKSIPERKKAGMLTAYYVCTNDHYGNQFTISKLGESTWTAYYTMAQGMDGFLRWAYNCWPKDPIADTTFSTWPAGDTFFVYPGPRSSLRWEMLRDGIEEFEKIRIIRENLKDSEMSRIQEDYQRMEATLKEFVYDESKLIQKDYTANLVRKMRTAVVNVSRWLN